MDGICMGNLPNSFQNPYSLLKIPNGLDDEMLIFSGF